MALTILYTATMSSDFKSVAIQDAGTTWGQGGEMGTGDVTAISLYFFGTDKVTPLKAVAFTSQERTDFLAGSVVTLQMSDSRLWYPASFAPDNFYTLQLHVEGGTVVETQVAIVSWFYMKKIIINSFTSLLIPQSTYFDANRNVTGNLVSFLQLQYQSDNVSIPRETMWRKVYNDLSINYANQL